MTMNVNVEAMFEDSLGNIIIAQETLYSGHVVNLVLIENEEQENVAYIQDNEGVHWYNAKELSKLLAENEHHNNLSKSTKTTEFSRLCTFAKVVFALLRGGEAEENILDNPVVDGTTSPIGTDYFFLMGDGTHYSVGRNLEFLSIGRFTIDFQNRSFSW